MEISPWNESDPNFFGPLVRSTAERFAIGDVTADKAYLNKRNVALVEEVGGVPFIPFKSNSKPMLDVHDTPWARMYHRFAYDREEFLTRYHRRSNVETTFSMIKSKFGDSVLSKSPVGQANEVLVKCLAHNVVVVGQAIHEFGIDALPYQPQAALKAL